MSRMEAKLLVSSPATSNGIFNAVEQAQVMALAVHSDESAPFLGGAMPVHSVVAGSVGSSHSHVLGIDSLGNASEVAQLVVRAVAVDVIDGADRPSPVHNCPSHPVCGLARFHHLAVSVSVIIHSGECFFPRISCIPSLIARAITPKYLSGFWLISEQLTQKVRGDFTLRSHWRILISRWLGLLSVPALSGPFLLQRNTVRFNNVHRFGDWWKQVSEVPR